MDLFLAAIITGVMSGVVITTYLHRKSHHPHQFYDPFVDRYMYPTAPIYTAAEKQAQEIFLAHCTPHQQHTWAESGYIDIRGSLGGQYHLHNYDVHRFTANVTYSDKTGPIPLCVVLKYNENNLPQYDRFLAQKTLLEVDEAAFRSLIGYPLPRR